MRSRKLSSIRHKLRVGFTLRCPACEQGKLFTGRGRDHFKMEATCPYCHARFERTSGEMIGGVYINVAVAELLAVAGFFVSHALLAPPPLYQVLFWVPFVVIFSLLFYRRARGLWVAVMYLGGAVYPDPDYTREYYGPADNVIPLHPENENEGSS
jgi:uncharacterized protein (DUF983 family)